MKYLVDKIDCFQKFCVNYPATALTINGYLANLCSFDREPDFCNLSCQQSLLNSAWEAHAKACGKRLEDSHYDELLITGEDM